MEKNCVVASFYIEPSTNATALPLSDNELRNLVRTFRYFNYGRAIKVLFRFTYGTKESKQEAISWFNQKTIEDGKVVCLDDYVSKVMNFTDQQFCLLADELFCQYKANDPKFLDIHSIKGIPAGCQNELNLIQEKMKKHPVLLFRVVEKCVQAKKNPSVSRYVVQLLSKNTASHTLALKSLGFNFKYRVRLSDYSNEIGSLLLTIRQNYVKNQKLLSTETSVALPLIALLKQINELDKQVYLSSHKDNTIEEFNSSHKVSVFEDEVIKFIELSSTVTSDEPFLDIFMRCRQKLEELGEAIIYLLKAQIEYNNVFDSQKSEGFLFAVVTDIALSKKMFNAEQTCIKAKKYYYSAFENFHRFILEHFEVI